MKGPANDMGSLMSIERDRFLSLVEFAQQSARLRSKPAATVSEHGVLLYMSTRCKDCQASE
jgi:hypothetical protein